MSIFPKHPDKPETIDARVKVPDEPEIYPSSKDDYSPESRLADDVIQLLWLGSKDCPLTYGREGTIKYAAAYESAVARSVYAIKQEIKQARPSRYYRPKEGLLTKAKKKIEKFRHRHDNPQA